ncbi:MAG: tRNA (adenosine(37)-N6)-threonylcarbamoyltransferase complex dimerization subunit type 1 TsaB [Clostridiales bacterium]|nr:tRNA (adenosine(37)-N6)-threonylcarbamoyltransferase complex dimerization subunit type 1 TsaB [Clostridiales bacterium]
MIIFACDTSNSSCCAGVYNDTRPLAFRLSMENKTHSETFMPLVDEVMDEAGLSYDELDCFAVTTGPGSFTGIRIGLSAVKGMALASGKPCIAVSSTAALAMSCEIAEDYGRPTYYVPCFDARNNRVFAQLISRDGRHSLVEEDAYDAFAFARSVKAVVGASKPRLLVVGNGAETVRTNFEEVGLKAEYAKGAVILPKGIVTCALADPVMISGAEIKASYCAVSQAERFKK